MEARRPGYQGDDVDYEKQRATRINQRAGIFYSAKA